MRFNPLALIALLTPLPAAAFGDLDCISLESCGNGGCGPADDVFAVSFDWQNDAAMIDINDASYTLPLATSGENDTTVVTEYGDLDSDVKRALRIEATDGAVIAYFTFKDPSVTTLVADCNNRQDA